MTATAADLQIEFRRLRDVWHESGDGRYAVERAYNAWFHQSRFEGNPPDALRPNAGNESERFFSRTIPGVDGHTYWALALHRAAFPLDSGERRHPRWWWYEHVNGPQGRGHLGPVCGEPNCITPEHQRYLPWSEVKRRFSDQQILGSLQVAARRLGHAPTMQEYATLKLKPYKQVIAVRFAGWNNALRAAGLEPSHASIHKRGPEDCIAGLQYLARHLGHPPTDNEYRTNHALLAEAGLPPSASTVRHHLGSWSIALKKAGLA